MSLPWFITRGPQVSKVLTSEVDIEDHLGKATIQVVCWINGEGFDAILLRDKQPEQRVEITWSEWSALRRAVKAITEREAKA